MAVQNHYFGLSYLSLFLFQQFDTHCHMVSLIAVKGEHPELFLFSLV